MMEECFALRPDLTTSVARMGAATKPAAGRIASFVFLTVEALSEMRKIRVARHASVNSHKSELN